MGCHPECTWLCSEPVCIAECKYVTEPPVCICEDPSVPPNCRIECAEDQCETESCPNCEIFCNEECGSANCLPLISTWACRKPDCPYPVCELNCEMPSCPYEGPDPWEKESEPVQWWFILVVLLLIIVFTKTSI